ncbi:class I SAM-dependent methyltransferase [Alkalihalobacillus sp. TS-13]|uniref:class I SAM-dependent methyltransferase n=1 Tax=Alkalihalobacillus sp. TS-13 TaxID=2842455 RepID=UPI001C86B128|nr:class I SAM-dependent methyltransferase [Alkalihalobacillus sp. TS-13]
MGVLQKFINQFKKPEGFFGRVAGLLMAREPEKSAWTVSLLNPAESDRALEVGFGPGRAIEILSQKITEGYIVGIEISEVMLRMARKRNKKAISKGIVDLRLTDVSNLPSFEEKFDYILSVNSIMFWEYPVHVLKNLRNHLKPNGKIAITVHPRMKRANNETAKEFGKEIDHYLREAGYSENQIHIRKMKPVPCVCVTAVNRMET